MDSNLVSRQMTKQQRSVFIYGFDTFVDSSFLVMQLFTIESAFRSFYTAIFSQDPPFRFSELYKELLPAIGLDKYIKLLKLASLIRNTLHNGNIYTLKNDSVEWRGKTYYFEKDKSVKLGDIWFTLTMITEDIHEMLEKLVKSDAILQRPEIVDASYSTI